MRSQPAGSLEHTCRPLSFCDIGPPFLPVAGALAVFLEALLLLCHVLLPVDQHHGGTRNAEWRDSKRGAPAPTTRTSHGAGLGVRVSGRKRKRKRKKMETGEWGNGGFGAEEGHSSHSIESGPATPKRARKEKRGKSDHDGRLWGLPLLLPASLPAIGRSLSSLLIADAKQGKQGRGANSIHCYIILPVPVIISY